MRVFLQVLVAAVVALVSAPAVEAADFPAIWRKTMTNDPASNHDLAEALKPLANKDAESLRIVKLYLIVGDMCAGTKIDKRKSKAYFKGIADLKLSEQAFKEAHFLADNRFVNFNYRQLVHLCAGTAYMFGKEGRLVSGMIAGGNGQPAQPYNPGRPYLRAPFLGMKGNSLAVIPR